MFGKFKWYSNVFKCIYGWDKMERLENDVDMVLLKYCKFIFIYFC